MNETLKGVANIGAELAAVKADLQREMERHRKTWRQLEQVTGLLREACELIQEQDARIEVDMLPAGRVLMSRIRAILSQQAEPDELVRLDKQCRDDVAAALGLARGGDFAWSYLLVQISECVKQAEPAPAQDEREAFEECWAIRGADDEGNLGRKPLRSLVDQQRYRGDAVNGSWVWFQRGAAWQRNRPAQTEQQPIGQWSDDEGLSWCDGSPHELASARESGWLTRTLYATPSPAMDAKEE